MFKNILVLCELLSSIMMMCIVASILTCVFSRKVCPHLKFSCLILDKGIDTI